MLPDVFQLALVMQHFMDDIQHMMNCFGVVGRCGEGIRTPRSQRSLKFIKERLPILAHLTTRKDKELHVLPKVCWATTWYPTPSPSLKVFKNSGSNDEDLFYCRHYYLHAAVLGKKKNYILLLFKIFLTSITLLNNSLSFHFFIILRMTFLQFWDFFLFGLRFCCCCELF